MTYAREWHSSLGALIAAAKPETNVFVLATLFTYTNGTRLRTRYLVPQYVAVDEDLERTAYARLGEALPGVNLVKIYADPMVVLGGSVQCMTLGLGAKLDPTLAVAPPLKWVPSTL